MTDSITLNFAIQIPPDKPSGPVTEDGLVLWYRAYTLWVDNEVRSRGIAPVEWRELEIKATVYYRFHQHDRTNYGTSHLGVGLTSLMELGILPDCWAVKGVEWSYKRDDYNPRIEVTITEAQSS